LACLVVGLVVALLLAACGSSSSTSGGSGKGTVSVAYAGSLVYLMEKVIDPAFTAATGDGVSGRSAGSKALSKEILSGEITPNVFISIGGKPIKALEPKFTKWYAQFASSPIVVAYNPKSKFAPQLKAIAEHRKPLSDLFTLMATPGFHLGRTDPNVDPQGEAFVLMSILAHEKLHVPSTQLKKILGGAPGSAAAQNSPEIFEETALEPRLEAGQLDAASAYLPQAIQLHLPYIDLGPALDFGDPKYKAEYATASFALANGEPAKGKPLTVDVTIIGKPTSASEAFVAYILSRAGLQKIAQNGYKLLHVKVSGDKSAMPPSVARAAGT
jgi:molybdate/tungstate transport system substrate-binding protein